MSGVLLEKVAFELKDVDKDIMDLLLEGRDEGLPWGRNTPSNLASDLEISRQWATTRLQMLESAGIVENIGGGVYEFREDPRGDSTNNG